MKKIFKKTNIIFLIQILLLIIPVLLKNIINVEYKQISFEFGNGNSSELFLEVIKNKDFWNTKIQKNFNDVI